MLWCCVCFGKKGRCYVSFLGLCVIIEMIFLFVVS